MAGPSGDVEQPLSQVELDYDASLQDLDATLALADPILADLGSPLGHAAVLEVQELRDRIASAWRTAHERLSTVQSDALKARAAGLMKRLALDAKNYLLDADGNPKHTFSTDLHSFLVGSGDKIEEEAGKLASGLSTLAWGAVLFGALYAHHRGWV